MWPCAWRRHCRARAVVAHGAFQRRRLLPHAHTMRLACATRTRAFIQSPLSGSLGAGSRDEAQGRPRAGLRDLAFRGMGGGPPLPRVGGRKEAWEAGSGGGAPFPRPPEVRRKRGSAPLGSESLSPSSALVTRWGVALLFSRLNGERGVQGGFSFLCLLFPGRFDFHHRGGCQASALPLPEVSFSGRSTVP